MKHLFLLFFSFAALLSFGIEQGFPGIVPRPKKVESSLPITLSRHFRNTGNGGRAASFLADELCRKYDWNPAREGRSTTIHWKKIPSLKRHEEFELIFARDSITVNAADEAGFFAASGRLLNLLAGGTAEFKRDEIQLNISRIHDYPDMPRRGMFLQMSFHAGASYVETVRRAIDLMRLLGYNFVVFEVGGRLESQKLPEAVLPNHWTQQQIRELIDYAEKRGLDVYPAINSIGHIERSLQLCPVSDKGRKIGQDISSEAFYRDYFTVLDEITELFGRPRYFHIGTDECQAVMRYFTSQGKNSAGLYSSFLERTSEHLKRFSVRPVIWHDMLLSPEEGAKMEPANACGGTWAIREKLPENCVIDYWCYDAVSGNPGLEKLLKTGCEIWISPWNSRPGTAELVNSGRKHGITTLLATSWSGVENEANAFVLPIEFAWNGTGGDSYPPDRVFNSLFHQRDRIAFSETRPLKPVLSPEGFRAEDFGASVSASGLSFPLNSVISGGKCKVHEIPVSALGANPGRKELYLLSPENRSAGIPLDGINISRGTRQVIVYLPNYGETTRTNAIGLEWIFRNGVVTQFRHGSFDGGNSPIPDDGGVLSIHDFSGTPRNIFARAELHPGTPIRFAEVTGDMAVKEDIVAEFRPSESAKGMALLTGASFHPVGVNSDLAILMEMGNDGKKVARTLRGDFINNFPLYSGDGLKCWSAGEKVVFEWRKEGRSSLPASICLKITPAGRKFGFTIFSCVEY